MEQEIEKQVQALSPDDYACYCKAVASLNEQIMKHAREVDRNFQKAFAVQDIDAPENVSKIVLKAFSEDWNFRIECVPHQPDILWCQRKRYDTDKRSAELKPKPCRD